MKRYNVPQCTSVDQHFCKLPGTLHFLIMLIEDRSAVHFPEIAFCCRKLDQNVLLFLRAQSNMATRNLAQKTNLRSEADFHRK